MQLNLRSKISVIHTWKRLAKCFAAPEMQVREASGRQRIGWPRAGNAAARRGKALCPR